MTTAQPSSDPVTRTTRPPKALLWAVGGLLVVVLAHSACSSKDPVEAEFVQTFRNDNPTLSVSAISDADLVQMAQRSCSPQGLSSADEVRLDTLDVDQSQFVDSAAPLCPSR